MKRIVSLFLSVLMVVTMLPYNAWAFELSEIEELPEEYFEEQETFPEEEKTVPEIEEKIIEIEESGFEHETLRAGSVVASGDCGANGSNVTWSFDSNGVLTISGTGAMADYTVNYTGSGFVTTAPWRKYSGSFTALVIEEGITAIGSYAFYECDGFSGSLVIPNSVSDINEDAFSGCDFDSLVMGQRVSYIGDYAFSGCGKMKGRVAFNRSPSINDSSFSGCGIDDYYFKGTYPGVAAAYYSHPSFDEDDTLYYLADNSSWSGFAGGFKTIGIIDYGYCGGEGDGTNLVWTLDEYGTLTIFGNGAMADYSLNNNITTAPWAEYSENLKSLVIENGVTTVGKYAFNNCSKIAGNLIIPESITNIGDGAFGNCSGFTGDIVIPDSVEKIGNGAFSGCSGFNGHLIFGEGVEWIDASAFVDCVGLNGRTVMPENIKKISGYAFHNCGVNEYYFEGNAPETENDVFDVDADIIYYTSDSGTWLISNDKWNGYASKEMIAFGSCGVSVQWTLDSDGLLAIFGSGAMLDYSSDGDITTAPWAEYTNHIETLVIEERITTIGSYAFYNCFNLTGNVVIPDSLTQINSYAFYETCLNGIVFGKNLKTINNYAFYNCALSGNLVMPDSLTGIGVFAFAGCSQLSGDLIFSGNLKQIKGMAFNSCGINNYYFEGDAPSVNEASSTYPSFDALQDTIYYPANNTTWKVVDGMWKGYFAKSWSAPLGSGFCGSAGDGTNLKWIIDSEGTLTISGEGKMADYSSSNPAPWKSYMGSVNSLVIENGVTGIGVYAFYNCDGLTGDLVIPDSVTTIGSSAFYDCDGFTGNLIIGKKVSNIGNYAFYSCGKFKGNVTFYMSQLGNIDEKAFYDCGINNYYFRSSCPEMEEAWDSNDTLYYVENQYRNGWNSLGYGYKIAKYAIAAGNCGENYRDLDWTIDTNGILTISGFGAMANYTYEYGDSKYITSAPWADYLDKFSSIVIESGVTTIGDYAFYNCGNITGDLVIPDSVTSIGNSAFYYCSGFTGDLVIPDSVTTMGSSAFYGCSGFDGSLIIPDSITTIENSVFRGCSGFTGSLTIPDSVTTIGSSAFEICRGFTGDLVIPDSVTSIGRYAFENCSGFNGSLIIPDNVTVIENYAFKGCSGFTGRLILSKNVTAIKGYAFYNCGINEYYFKGNAPIVAGTSEDYPSFNSNTDTLYYPIDNNTWSMYEGKWNGYNAKPWNPDAIAFGYCGADADGKNLLWVIDNDGVLTISGTGEMADYSYTYIDSKQVSTAPWTEYSDKFDTLVIEEGVSSIGEFAFYRCENLKGDLTIPGTVKTIGRNAFFACGFDGKLVISEGVEKIEDTAFGQCSGFTGDLIIPDSVIRMMSSFKECSGFDGKLYIGSGLTTITNQAFWGCSGLTGYVVLSENVDYIATRAFGGCGINEFYFAGDAPQVAGTSSTMPSFDADKDTLYYVANNTTWSSSVENNVWNGYKALGSKLGDINGSGVVDVQDVYTARLIAAKFLVPNEWQMILGDVDGDGRINAIDANLIRKYAINLISSFPIEQL